MHFTALAIKTANETPNSLCALEIAVVKHGRITLQKNWFFRPDEMRFEPIQQRLYSIHPIDVIDAPDFGTEWEEISTYLENQVVICHQASYVWSTLCEILDQYHFPYPNCYFSCTMLLARCAYNNLHSRKLNDICNYLGITCTPSEPTSSAAACAQILLKLAKTYGAIDCEDLLQALYCTWGKVSSGQVNWPSFNIHLTTTKSVPSNHACSPFSLEGQVVCLTGPLDSMTRVQAVKHLNRIGAAYSSSVTNKTTVVITNVEKPDLKARNRLTSKLRRALMLIDEGYPITIMNEATFLTFL